MQKSETSTSPFMMTFSLLLQPETQNFIWCQIISMWKFVAKCQKSHLFFNFLPLCGKQSQDYSKGVYLDYLICSSACLKEKEQFI